MSVFNGSLEDPTPTERRRQMSRPRVAEMIASAIRSRILDGRLADGDMLPKVDDLAEMYQVSKPSVREAMRILETEGLVSARRGGLGGAEVHMPTAATAAYTIGMVLQSTQATVGDLATALLALEPTCAEKAAERPDRLDTVLPHLQRLQTALETSRDDPAGFTMLARRFHKTIVHGCGNQTLALVAGALESLWSRHESKWLEFRDQNLADDEVARKVILAHAAIIDAVRDGDADRARALVAQHLSDGQTYVLSDGAGQRITVCTPFPDVY
jgi:DNA-binding FadR family transcriptional regulator